MCQIMQDLRNASSPAEQIESGTAKNRPCHTGPAGPVYIIA